MPGCCSDLRGTCPGLLGPIRQGESVLLHGTGGLTITVSFPASTQRRNLASSGILGKGVGFPSSFLVTPVDTARTQCAECRLVSHLEMGQAQFGGMFICFLINVKSIYLI